MKKLLAFIICVFGLFTMSSCEGLSAEVAVGLVEVNTSTKRLKKYNKLSSKDKFSITVENEIIVHVEIVTESGNLDLKIGDDWLNGFSGSNMQTCSFDVTLSGAGVYDVIVTTKNHEGSYEISW